MDACGSYLCTRHYVQKCAKAMYVEFRDYNAGWGQRWFAELILFALTRYMKEAAEAMAVHSRPAFGVDTGEPLVPNQIHWLQGRWQEALKALTTDRLQLLAITATDSEANGMLEPLANMWVNRGNKGNRKQGAVIVMEGCTVGARGPLTVMSSRKSFRESYAAFADALRDETVRTCKRRACVGVQACGWGWHERWG